MPPRPYGFLLFPKVLLPDGHRCLVLVLAIGDGTSRRCLHHGTENCRQGMPIAPRGGSATWERVRAAAHFPFVLLCLPE